MVQQPGTYPWRPGITLRQLMVLARGPKIGADLREAEIAKLPADRSHGQLATTARVPLDSTYLFERDSAGRYVGPPGVSFPARGTATEIPLEPYDNVLIFRQPDFELQRTVTIIGEVAYPGTYALRAKDDRLADLVQRAGGLTPRAYPEGIRFVREIDNRGRINIDLPRALREHDSRDNIILQPGDSVRIPEYQPSVRVTGAVNSPGSVLYRRGAGLDYYLSAAGGFTRSAEKGQVSVRYANGEVRTRGRGLLGGRPSPGPGSEVYVPAKDPNAPRTDTVALFGAIAQILASTVAIIVIATR
jgi:protein involved in polysaccharide export with SLBB domain